MKPLRKNDSRRFSNLCTLIRKALHVDHQRISYKFGEHKTHFASHEFYHEGIKATIYVHPSFWKLDFEEQLRTLIHEHVHHAMIPFDQAIYNSCDRIPENARSYMLGHVQHSREHYVDHMACVLFDLIKLTA